MASVDLITSAGAASSVGRVSWGGSARLLAKVPWLPPFHVKPVDANGNWNPAVYKALKYLFEEVIGGIDAPTLPQLRTDVTSTQVQVSATTNYAKQVSQYAQGIAATAEATAQVTQDSGLSGSGSIPPPPTVPPPPDGGWAL